MREHAEPVPCPECFKDAGRIMPTSFAAFTFRDGYPRRIPDDGKFYHLGKKVTKPVKRARPNEHPEINKPKPKPRMLKGQKQEIRDMQELAKKDDLKDMYGNRVKPTEVKKMVGEGRIIRQGRPDRG
jgi:hypothetical protein